jgi:hypothetical protein
MKTAIAGVMGAVFAAASITFVTPAPAAADTNFWTGYVVHVSTTNIKVENKAKTQTLSFLLVPKFKRVFSDDGKTTYQMAQIKPGMIVRVVYDQDLLGARHADKIYVLDARGQTLKATGS